MRKSMLLMIALLVGTVATVLANQYLNASSETGGLKTTEIFVAAASIEIGEAITPERVRLEQWPADKIPEGATGDFATLEKQYANQRFYTGEPIMPVKLTDENFTQVPPGYKAVAMNASHTNITNLIQPGDRVDVLARFDKSEVDPFGTAKTVLQGIRVYALDGDTQRRAGEDRSRNVRTIQLLINAKDQQAWSLASKFGTIDLALGSSADYTNDDGSNEAAGEFMEWFRQYQSKYQNTRGKVGSRTSLGSAPIRRDQTTPQQIDAPEEKGFVMQKLVEGRFEQYLVYPGKPPVLINQSGESAKGSSTRSLPESDGFESSSNPRQSFSEVDDYSYLNGEDSPLFQPPTNQRRSRIPASKHSNF